MFKILKGQIVFSTDKPWRSAVYTETNDMLLINHENLLIKSDLPYEATLKWLNLSQYMVFWESKTNLLNIPLWLNWKLQGVAQKYEILNRKSLDWHHSLFI